MHASLQKSDTLVAVTAHFFVCFFPIISSIVSLYDRAILASFPVRFATPYCTHLAHAVCSRYLTGTRASSANRSRAEAADAEHDRITVHIVSDRTLCNLGRVWKARGLELQPDANATGLVFVNIAPSHRSRSAMLPNRRDRESRKEAGFPMSKTLCCSTIGFQRAVNPNMRVLHLRRVSDPELLEKGREAMSQLGCCCWVFRPFQMALSLHLGRHLAI
jgi:hypothetical protein